MLTHPVIDPVVRLTPLDPLSIAFFILAFAGIAYASARKPSLGIALLVLAIPVSFSHDVGHTTITLGKVALVANALGILATRTDARGLALPAQRLLLLCGLAVTACTALSVVHALYRGAVLRETLKAVEYVCTFAVVALAIRADDDERPIRLALLMATAVVAGSAILEEFTGAPSGLWFANVPIPRIAGPLEGPNQLAAYLGLLLALVIALSVRRTAARLETAVVGIASTALVLTISRSGVVASLVGIGIVLALRKGPQTRRFITAIATGGGIGIAFIGLLGFLATHTFGGIDLLGHFSTLAEASSPGSVGTRSQLWHAAFVLWRAHPVFGIGAGNYERELGLAGYPQLRTHANSLYIQALVEGGIPLLCATLALVYASITPFARGPFDDPFIAAAFGASIGLAGHQIFDLLVFYPKVGDQWWLLLALAAVRIDRVRARGT